MNFVAELKHRNVFRVGIAYLIGAWLFTQVADVVLGVISAPDSAMRAVVAILALAFIPTVIFAWVYEMTPEGVKKASEIDKDTSITHQTGKKLDIATMIMVVSAVIFVFVERYLPDFGDPDSEAATPLVEETTAESVEPASDNKEMPATSIAVLPFANRSNAADDLYFTDGIHDDLLTQLAKIHDLTVISRTSVMEYRDSTRNMKEIGAELNVGTILEGGVQKVGNRVRINAQLIEVATDRHLWAETFDRELTAENVFELQSEIARRIVEAVSVELTDEEEELLKEIPTSNLAAYDAYLRGMEIINGANYARTEEEAALVHGVIDHVEQPAGNTQRAAGPDAEHHVADLADRVIAEQSLQVVLHQRQEHGDEDRGHAECSGDRCGHSGFLVVGKRRSSLTPVGVSSGASS